MKVNQEKSYHCTAKGVYACYNDSRKHSFIEYETSPTDSLQLYGNSYKGKTQSDFEDHRYSFQQNKLYQRCLYGLKSCTAEEIALMSLSEKINIQINHKKTQQLINLSKWKATVNLAGSVMNTWFKKQGANVKWFIDAATDIHQDDNQDINMGLLRDIGGKETLINALIGNNILPPNFFNLKAA